MKEEREMLELRTKITKEAYMRIRFIFIKEGKGSISKAVNEAILNYWNDERLRKYIKM